MLWDPQLLVPGPYAPGLAPGLWLWSTCSWLPSLSLCTLHCAGACEVGHGTPAWLPRRGFQVGRFGLCSRGVGSAGQARVTPGDPGSGYKGGWRTWVACFLSCWKPKNVERAVGASGLVVPGVSLLSFLGQHHTEGPSMAGQTSGRCPQPQPSSQAGLSGDRPRTGSQSSISMVPPQSPHTHGVSVDSRVLGWGWGSEGTSRKAGLWSPLSRRRLAICLPGDLFARLGADTSGGHIPFIAAYLGCQAGLGGA